MTVNEIPWPTRAPIEGIAYGDAYIEANASALDTAFPGFGDILRETWAAIRPLPTCACTVGLPHRWDCALTPIWAQMVRESPCFDCGHGSHPGQQCGHPIYGEERQYVGGMIFTRLVFDRQCACGRAESYLRAIALAGLTGQLSEDEGR